jgi:hypothetical protein
MVIDKQGRFTPDGFGQANQAQGSARPLAQQPANSFAPAPQAQMQKPAAQAMAGFDRAPPGHSWPTPANQRTPGMSTQASMIQAQPQMQVQKAMGNQYQQLGAAQGQPPMPMPHQQRAIPMAYQPAMPQQSVMQSVDNRNPQSVQNFLTALNQVGAGNNNAFMNAPGQQGVPAQYSFGGSQYQQAPVFNNGPVMNQLGYQQNAAQQGVYGGGGYGQAGGVIQGGTGGVAGQPVYQAPVVKEPQAVDPYSNFHPNFASISDVNAKTNITPAHQELESFLNSLGVHSYEYIDKADGEGRRISPMAQEIEKTPLGAVAIKTDANGHKMVDYGKLMGTQLAALALLNQKYNTLEKQMKENILNNLSASHANGHKRGK